MTKKRQRRTDVPVMIENHDNSFSVCGYISYEANQALKKIAKDWGWPTVKIDKKKLYEKERTTKIC